MRTPTDLFRASRHVRKHLRRAIAIPLRATLALALTVTPLLSHSAFASDEDEGATTFTVRIENISGHSKLPSPFAPGVYAVHDGDTRPLFDADAPDRGQGLAAIAEDGNPADLAANLDGATGISSSGVFNTPAGADGPGPIFPGGAYEFDVTAHAGDYLSFASMYVQTNDVFVAPDQNGIALFDGDGHPISGDITKQTPLWDVGSEINEAPGMGPNQAPRQSGADTGPAEGGVSAFSNSTRSLPLATAIVDAQVEENGGTYTIHITNVSATSGAIDTPIAPLFYATHNGDWSLFKDGETASAGLEMQAEDGSPAGLVDEHTGAAGTGMVGAAGDGPAGTGDGYSFDVTPTMDYPYLTFSGMVVQTNDAFFAPSAKGIALLHSDGTPRSAADVQHDIDRMLAIWDAGTEANEVPGVGPHQAPRQPAPNSGEPDPIAGVRLYADATNDLAGTNAGGFLSIDIKPLSQSDTFLVSVKNTSGDTAYPGILTPVVWATHTDAVGFFEIGADASAGLEALAEDGNGAPLADALGSVDAVAHSGVISLPNGADAGGPLMPGDGYHFAIKASADAPYFSFASMIVPSNDTFAAFGPDGINLYNDDGTRRTQADLAAEIATTTLAWDAGTEQNQAGAAGPDQAPRQAGPNTGADEGNGYVRLTTADYVWDYPSAEEVVRITITPHDMGGTDPMPEPDPTEPDQVIYISSDYGSTVVGVEYTQSDIIGYNTNSGEWSTVFDGSDLGIYTNNLRAFDWLPDGSLLASFSYSMRIDGIGWLDDSDIVRIIPTSLGGETAGSMELYFDGSNVGLSKRGEDIDALHYAPNGDLIISTLGGYHVQGMHGHDEDLLRFTPTTLGEETSGTWSLEFDGSDVGLTHGGEDLRGSLHDAESGDIYLTTRFKYSVQSTDGSELRGDSDDIFICTPVSLGDDTVCDFAHFWDGDAHGFDTYSLAAFDFAPAHDLLTGQAIRAASATVAQQIEEMTGAEMDAAAASDVEADEMDQVEDFAEQVLLPFVGQ